MGGRGHWLRCSNNDVRGLCSGGQHWPVQRAFRPTAVPFNRMHRCARAKTPMNGHVNGRPNATVRRWNVAYGGPYYDYVPGIMASV